MLRGRAGDLLESLGPRARVHRMYDGEGARMYHDISLRDSHEVREVVRLVRSRPGPVLDLAAGSGRLTIPLLAAGLQVTALESSASMLVLLGERLAQLPERLVVRCTVVQADMSDFLLAALFDSVVLATTSVSLLDAEGRAGLFRCVERHLAPGGQLILSTVDIPSVDRITDTDVPVVGESGQQYRVLEHFDPATSVRSVTLHPALETVPTDTIVDLSTSEVQVLPPDQLVAELAEHGFATRLEQESQLGESHRHVMLVAERAGPVS